MTIENPENIDNPLNTNPPWNTFWKKEICDALFKEFEIYVPGKDAEQFKESLEDIADDTLIDKLNQVSDTAKKDIENILLIYEEFSKRGFDHLAVIMKRIAIMKKQSAALNSSLNALDKKFIELMKKTPWSE